MNGLNPFDQAVMGFVQTHCHNPLADAVFPVITYLGEGGALWIILAVALLIFGRKTGRKTGVLMLLAMLAGLLIGELALKNIVCRPRPFVEFPDYAKALIPPALIPPPSGYSFPSGHSCSSFAAATVIFMLPALWPACPDTCRADSILPGVFVCTLSDGCALRGGAGSYLRLLQHGRP